MAYKFANQDGLAGVVRAGAGTGQEQEALSAGKAESTQKTGSV